jgi:hypothetical protein
VALERKVTEQTPESSLRLWFQVLEELLSLGNWNVLENAGRSFPAARFLVTRPRDFLNGSFPE